MKKLISVPLTIFLLWWNCSGALGETDWSSADCNSFEECTEKASHAFNNATSSVSYYQNKAIAFKFADIEKELKNRD